MNDNPGEEPVYKQEDLDLYLSGDPLYASECQLDR